MQLVYSTASADWTKGFMLLIALKSFSVDYYYDVQFGWVFMAYQPLKIIQFQILFIHIIYDFTGLSDFCY